MDVEKKFLQTIEKHGFLKRRDRIILGVSGGPDSICMLHLFYKIKDEFKLDLICAHFNHGLREDSDEDEKFVRDICKKLKVKFISEKKNVGNFFFGDSLEQTARNLRLDFFLKVARRFKIKKIALAHTKDDVVETILMRLIRGTGLQGLRGILPQSKFKKITFIRPLIELEKEEILEWLKQKGLSYKVDYTNFQDKFFRNRIRHKLLPLLANFNPQIKNVIFNLSRILSFDYDFLMFIAKDIFSKLKKQKSYKTIRLNLEELKEMHPSLILQILRLAIEEVKGDTRRLEYKHFEQILDMIQKKKPSLSLDVPQLQIKKEDGWLSIRSLLF